MMLAVWVMAAAFLRPAEGADLRTRVEIDAGWDSVLARADDLEAGALALLDGPDGGAYVVSAGRGLAAAAADARTRVAARRTAELDARAAFTRFVSATVQTETRATTVRTTSQTSASDGTTDRLVQVQRYLHDVTRERAEGVLRDSRVVGTWMAADGLTVVAVLAVPVPTLPPNP